MIESNLVTKTFGQLHALKELSCKIKKGCIYGMIGSNGAGKSTFLRLITGVYRADSGEITLEGNPIFENDEAKSRIAYVPDELFFINGASMNKMANTYRHLFPQFDHKRFEFLTDAFKLTPTANINSFSKGMKRQVATILALSRKPDYMFFDETFDGLDPVMRNLVKNLIAEDVLERNTTVIVTSHSLRELEDTCDQLALLHRGGIVLESDVQNLKTSLFKVQVAFTNDYDRDFFSGLDILSYQKRGSVANLIVRGDRESTATFLQIKAPVLLDILPLSLEEVFIYEMEALGYAFKDVLK